MKRRSLVLFAIGLFGLSTLSVLAMDKKHENRHQAMQAKLLEKLELEPARAEQVKTILDDAHAQKKAIRQTMRSKLKEVRDKESADLEQVLTEQEMQLLKKAKRRMHKKLAKKRHMQAQHVWHGKANTRKKREKMCEKLEQKAKAGV